MVKKIKVIQGLTKYLLKNGYAERSVEIYTDRIRGLVEKHTMHCLLSNLNKITNSYYDGGANFDPKDHGNTAAALQQLKCYLLLEKRNNGAAF